MTALRERFKLVYAQLAELRRHTDAAAVAGNVERYGRAIGHLQHVKRLALRIEGEAELLIDECEERFSATTTIDDERESA